MTYFAKFPHIAYEFNGNSVVVKDILRRAKFLTEYKPYTDIYEPYTILDGDTPQSLGASFYGASTYHWVILLFNEIHNPSFDWPLTALTLIECCILKYGVDSMYKVRHFENDGVVVGEVKDFVKGVEWIPPVSIGQNLYPVSFFEYEERMNDDRRVITIMRPELLSDFVSQFGESING
jgi:hypothetical protein